MVSEIVDLENDSGPAPTPSACPYSSTCGLGPAVKKKFRDWGDTGFGVGRG